MKKSLLGKLSQREQEVVPLLADGLRYKEIAESLCLSTETIRTHVRNIYKKLEVSSRTEALNKIYKRVS
ncbi:MAG: LuxR C-terminal-related transcriptional regulator [Bacteroidia bacterium]